MDPHIEKQETEYILQDLLRSRNRNDIISGVCHRTSCTWVEAEYLLEKVMRNNRKFIRQETNPLRLIVSILGAAVGLIWITSNVFTVLRSMLPWLAENGSLAGYTLPDSPWLLAGETVVALAMVIIGMFLTQQQLKIIRGQ
jgi:hypothetical protein